MIIQESSVHILAGYVVVRVKRMIPIVNMIIKETAIDLLNMCFLVIFSLNLFGHILVNI